MLFKECKRYFFKKLLVFSQHLVMESPRLEEENIIKDIRRPFRLEKLEKDTVDTTIKNLRNRFTLEKNSN